MNYFLRFFFLLSENSPAEITLQGNFIYFYNLC
nr:MAG TPA: hypothetical protein [Caudoviricetes sp.]